MLVVYTPAEAERVKHFVEGLLEALVRNDISEYRAHIGYMGGVNEQPGFKNNALGRRLSSIKGLLEPSGILSPRKSGNWMESAAPKS